MRARLQVDGLKAAQKRIDETGARAKRPEPALRARDSLEDLTASEERRFQSTRGWRRLTPGWVAEKRRRGLDPRILRATAKLYRALTSGRGLTFRAFAGTLYWGIPAGRSDLFYAQVQAKKRRMVVIDKTARDRIAVRVERYIADGVVE